jgi:hypothetical protein
VRVLLWIALYGTFSQITLFYFLSTNRDFYDGIKGSAFVSGPLSYLAALALVAGVD